MGEARHHERAAESPSSTRAQDEIVDEAFLAAWVERLRATVPKAVAVILKGSYARGDAGPHSDIDFDVLTAGEARGVPGVLR